MTLRVLACPDKFRGSATAGEVAAAMAAGVQQLGGDCMQLPLADGGEGTLEAFGGANRTSVVAGPLGSPVDAGWRMDGDVAVVEAARACGLQLAGGASGNDPVNATTRGVGELIAAAAAAGATRILLGVGGSATTDGGAGALDALTAADIALGSALELVVCCDVTTTYSSAAQVYGPQKGADPAQVAYLTARLLRQRADLSERAGFDLDTLAGSGAAGGLAGGLAAVGARLVPGFDAVADHLGLDAAIAGVDLVLTGEGRLDATSLHGKVVGGVLTRASRQGIDAAVVCGTAQIEPGVRYVDLTATFGADRSWRDTVACIREATVQLLRAPL